MNLHELEGKFYIKTDDGTYIEVLKQEHLPKYKEYMSSSPFAYCSNVEKVKVGERHIITGEVKYGTSNKNVKRVYSKVLPEFDIEDVIYNGPATIVKWKDGTKTVVKCENEDFDKEKGLAMCFAKKAMGNTGHYYETFKKWCPEDEKIKPIVLGNVINTENEDGGVKLVISLKKTCANCKHRDGKRKSGGSCRACTSALMPDGTYSSPSHWESEVLVVKECKKCIHMKDDTDIACLGCIDFSNYKEESDK